MTKLRIALALAVACLLGAPTASATTPTPITHIVLVMEENHSYSQTYGTAMPYLTSLANTYGLESNEHSIGLPSLPNYIALTSGNLAKASGGSFIGTDCSPASSCQSSADNIFHQTGGDWRGLSESMPSNCDHSNSGNYAVRHTASPYYTDIAAQCSKNDVGYSKTSSPDVSAAFTLIAPNLCDDAHGKKSSCTGSLSVADAWLKSVVGAIMSGAQYQSGDTLIEVTFDSGGPNNTVETVLVNPQIAAKKVTLSTTHYSLLRLNEELLGYPLLGKAASAPDMRSAFGL